MTFTNDDLEWLEDCSFIERPELTALLNRLKEADKLVRLARRHGHFSASEFRAYDKVCGR